MIVKEIVDLIDKGIQPVIKFNKNIESLETEIDDNMIGKALTYIIDLEGTEDQYYRIIIDLAPYLIHNLNWMKYNYYDKNHNPNLNCIEAGFYKEGKIELFISPCDTDYGNMIDDPNDKTKQMLSDAFKAGQESMYLAGIESDGCSQLDSHTTFNEWYEEYTKEKIYE